MKILHLINSLNVGGAERMLVKLCRSDAFADDRILIVTFLKKGLFAAELEKAGHQVICLGVSKNPLTLYRLIYLFFILRKFQPDLIQSWLYHSDLIAGMLGMFFRVPIFWSIRQSNLSSSHNKFSTRLCIGACAKLSRYLPYRIISNSHQAQKTHTHRGYHKDSIIVIPNGFDIAEFSGQLGEDENIRKQLGISADALLVGMVGRFDSQKNHAGFFHAAERVFEKFPAVHYCLVGSQITSQNRSLQQVIKMVNLPKENVHLLGHRSDISAVMQAFDVLALPSAGESFPNVVGEAMASSTPCVVTDVGDCASIVSDTGWVVAEGDMQEFADAIIAALSLPTEDRKKLGEKARKRISDVYSIENSASQFREHYRECIEKK